MAYELDQINILVHLVLNLVDRVTNLEQRGRYRPLPDKIAQMEGAVEPTRGIRKRFATEDDRIVICKLYSEGKSVDEIQSITSWSHQTIYNHLKAAGIPIKRSRTYTKNSARHAAATEKKARLA